MLVVHYILYEEYCAQYIKYNQYDHECANYSSFIQISIQTGLLFSDPHDGSGYTNCPRFIQYLRFAPLQSFTGRYHISVYHIINVNCRVFFLFDQKNNAHEGIWSVCYDTSSRTFSGDHHLLTNHVLPLQQKTNHSPIT